MAFLDYPGLQRFKNWMDNTYMKITAGNWLQIQRDIRLGYGPTLYPIGSQLTLQHEDYGDILLDVVAHDVVKKYGDASAHTMTLMTHACLQNLQFDAPEAFYFCESELAAGTYNITANSDFSSWTAGTYQFTLTQAVPAGGQLCINGNYSTALTSLKVVSYASRTTTTALETVDISAGSGSTSLGAFTVELNHPQRISYGSNNYKESAARQMINSDAAAGSVWTPQTEFDRPPSWLTTQKGFLNGCPADFLSTLGTAVVKCSANNTYEAPDSTVTKNTAYELNDKIFLASRVEVGFGAGDVADGSTLFQYYDGATNDDRIKMLGNAARYWWLRTPYSGIAHSVRYVYTDGSLDYYYASNDYGLVPACIIA